MWYEDSESLTDENIVVYRFLRVVFGLTSSPFLLNATIRHHVTKSISHDPEFVKKLLEDLYVDDTTSGTETLSEGKEFYNKAKTILSEAN